MDDYFFNYGNDDLFNGQQNGNDNQINSATRCPAKEDILLVINQLDINVLNIPLLLKQIMDFAHSFAHVIPDPESVVISKLRKFITILCLLTKYNESFSVKLTTTESRSNRNQITKILQINCANPSIVLKPVENAAISLIVGSSSIAPYTPFESEFPDIKFEEPIKIQQQDPMLNDRLLVTYTGKGETGVKFTLNYNSRDHPQVKKEIGISLLKILEVIPNGKIVLFHSEDYFRKLLECWRNTRIQPDDETSIMDSIFGSATAVICELDMITDADTERLMRNFEAAASTPRGAVCLALHRGKVYKNLDLNLETVPIRGIIHVGLPFGGWKLDRDIISKRQYLDEKYGGYECPQNLKWYIKESFRILNQSFCYALKEEGRREDCWGIVVVLHDRMRGEIHEFSDKFPAWIPRPKYHKEFSRLIQNVRDKIRYWTNDGNDI